MPPRKTVLATGVFDLLHIGHLRFLEESKRKGGRRAKLVVVVARDETVLHRKGRLPVMPEAQRRELVGALRVVDRAILGRREIDLLGILKEIRPDILSFGYDQNQIRLSVVDLIRREGLPVRVIRIGRFGPESLNSSSTLKKRVAKAVSS
ncbi:MAG TPA: adenylyltransferase/cytidyltransferase family protein [Candidatus Bathyarchaeia archaeon]|nr:adenylyltransferase/cytidyltransferase family protein [Candidatus Bathyarchaeia archaeon]